MRLYLKQDRKVGCDAQGTTSSSVSASCTDTGPEEHCGAGFCLKGGCSRTRRVACRGSLFSAFFASDSGTTNARWEHLLPSTKVA